MKKNFFIANLLFSAPLTFCFAANLECVTEGYVAESIFTGTLNVDLSNIEPSKIVGICIYIENLPYGSAPYAFELFKHARESNATFYRKDGSSSRVEYGFSNLMCSEYNSTPAEKWDRVEYSYVLNDNYPTAGNLQLSISYTLGSGAYGTNSPYINLERNGSFASASWSLPSSILFPDIAAGETSETVTIPAPSGTDATGKLLRLNYSGPKGSEILINGESGITTDIIVTSQESGGKGVGVQTTSDESGEPGTISSSYTATLECP